MSGAITPPVASPRFPVVVGVFGAEGLLGVVGVTRPGTVGFIGAGVVGVTGFIAPPVDGRMAGGSAKT